MPTQTKITKRAQKLVGRKRKFSSLDSDTQSTCSTASREKETEPKTNLSKMIKLAWKVRQNAYCPYSGF